MRSAEFWNWFETKAEGLSSFQGMNREKTFRQMFEHLDKFDRPVHIIETGCVRDPDNWGGDGCSSILFDQYVRTHPDSTARSVDFDPKCVGVCKRSAPRVQVTCGDSIAALTRWSTGSEVDLLFLDASEHNWLAESPSHVHHYKELMAIMPALRPDSLVVVDDSVIAYDDYPQAKIMGKGGLVALHAFEVGAKLEFCEYQVGFTNITGTSEKNRDADHIDEIIARARACVESDDQIGADKLYRLVMVSTPPPWRGRARVARGEAAANFGRNAFRVKKYGTSVDWYHTATVADPRCVDYRIDMVRSMVALGALKLAQREATIATTVEPNYHKVWSVLGGVESDLMNAEACKEAYDKQIEACLAQDPVDPFDLSDAYLNRATIALDTEDYAKVITLCHYMIENKVRQGDAYHMLAMRANRLGQHEAAIGYFDEAIANNARNLPLVHWNKGLSLHAIGRYKEGWEEHSWGAKEQTVQALNVPHSRFALPQWKGEPAPATIHIHTEAGYGDNISMLRYLPIMVEQGYTVHYECDPQLLSLVEHSMPQIKVMQRAIDYPGAIGIPKFDYHLPIGDLPHVFGTDIDTVPWNGSYIKADPEKSLVFKEKLKHIKGRKIGLCWSAGIRRNLNIWMERYGTYKSMQFSDVAPLLDVVNSDDEIISLQMGNGREEPAGMITDLLPHDTYPLWADTAALIANLDLVITVDTGVAHLAGAMGKPTWVMMQRDGASWHFMCYRPGASWNEASPWYPSVRVFRQHEFNKPGYWKDVVNDVIKAL